MDDTSQKLLAQFHLRPATSGDLQHTKALFQAYAASLPIDLSFQNFSAELAALPGNYAHPTGAIFLAFLGPQISAHLSDSGEPVGVIALRPLPVPNLISGGGDERRICEIKRLYLKSETRGMGIGKALVDEVLEEAKRLGYGEVRLDTLSSMRSARRLYEKIGFGEVERYYDSPVEGTVFMGLKL